MIPSGEKNPVVREAGWKKGGHTKGGDGDNLDSPH